MRKHRTAKGREFNMAQFSSDRGETVAVGNSGRNARGDLLGAGGKIVATNQQIVNKAHNKSTGQTTVKLNPLEQKTESLDTEVIRKEVVGADGVARWEITYADGSVEMRVKETQPAEKKKSKKASETDVIKKQSDTLEDFTIGDFINPEE